MVSDSPFHNISRPKIDEVELAFFGPGYGESIVVHIPGIGWGVVDSCQFGSGSAKTVPPLQYLKFQNVEKLAFLALTHPHKDHFLGMETIIAHYLGKIERVCRYAGEGARELAEYMVSRGIKGSQGAKSLSRVFKAFKEAVDHGAESRRLEAMTQLVPRREVTVNRKSIEVEVLSLSPGPGDENAYVDILRRAFVQQGGYVKIIPERDLNLIASAIWISVGRVAVILGSDVEKGKASSGGWRGIVSSIDAPDLAVKALKVAHHGSPNAFYRGAFEEHAKNGKITSVVTPNIQGKVRLPSAETIEKIHGYSNKVGLTSHVSYLRTVEVYDRAVARRLPERWRVIQPSNRYGMIIVRYDLTGRATLREAMSPAKWMKAS